MISYYIYLIWSHLIAIMNYSPKNSKGSSTSKKKRNFVLYFKDVSTAASTMDHVPLKKCLKQNMSCPLRRDSAGNQINYTSGTYKVSFRDQVQHIPVCDVFEIEAHKNCPKSEPCKSCVII